MTEPTSLSPDTPPRNNAKVHQTKKSTERTGREQQEPQPMVPIASDVSGRVALLMASSAVVVAIFLILLVMKAASSA